MAYFHFLAYFIFTSSLVAGQSTTYFLKGTSGLLKPVISGQPNSILWKHDGNKVVEFDGREQQVYSPYKDRITLDWLLAELNITGLRFEDSGVYDLEVEINHNFYPSKYKLEVIDKVSKPTISCEVNEGSSSDVSKTKAMLLCSAEPRKPESLMKFDWRSQGKNLQLGPKLTISLGDNHDEEEYSCSVSNPLSSETATFTARECYPDKSSSAVLAACLSILFILLLGTVVGIVFCKLRQKACFTQKHSNDLEKQSETEESDAKTGPTEDNSPLFQRDETLPSRKCLVPPKEKNNLNIKRESDEKTAPTEEKRPLLPRDETRPSHQRLIQDHNMSPDHPDITQKENNDSGVDERKMDFRKNREVFEKNAEGGLTTPPKDQANRHVHNKHDQDANQLQEPADVKLPEYSDTEKANNQDRASTHEESGEEAQSDQEPEETQQWDHSESEGNNGPNPAGVQAQSPEGDPNAVQPKEPANIPPPDSSHTAEANNQERVSTPKESHKEAEPGLEPEEASLSDHSESEGKDGPNPDDVLGQSPEDKPDEQPGSDEGTAQDGGNSPPVVDAATPTSSPSADCCPAGDNTTPGDHASNQIKDKDSEQESSRHKNTAVVSPSSSLGAEASLEHDPNPHDNMNNGDPETDQHEKTAKDLLQSDTTDPAEKNKQGQADESHSDNESADKPPEPKVRAGEDKEPSKEKSGSDLVNTETEKTVQGSDSSDTQQNGDLSSKTAEEESSNVPVQKDSDKKSEEDSRPQQTVTHTEEAKDQQETHNTQQSVTSSSTEVDTINNKKSPNTAQQNPADEESDSQTPEGGHSEGGN
ncbi:clumping factor A-like isoform X2 [Notolabrus celidotus]|uniref:clumping factor A-like isoform X2 n=1 Tax=Notolabrus celidotus TaxID=1203425 RepID=UPI00148F62F8|nr:clumping factor A-like isoform X2 [Notolabrus celidotus]XP_034549766.1 clumping factor A-like isoform X2 [Notolabrus celidotus]